MVTLVSEPAQSASTLSSSPVDPLAMTATPFLAVLLTPTVLSHTQPHHSISLASI